MNLGDLRLELERRSVVGVDEPFDRGDLYLNRAYQEMCGSEDWPFLEAQEIGTPPLQLSVPPVRSIESVVDTVQQMPLGPLDRSQVVSYVDADTTVQGTPYLYYLSGGDTVHVYPVATNQIQVRYWKLATDLADPTDEPLVPARFQMGIADGAAAYFYFGIANSPLAQSFLEAFERTKAQMREELLDVPHDSPPTFVIPLPT